MQLQFMIKSIICHSTVAFLFIKHTLVLQENWDSPKGRHLAELSGFNILAVASGLYIAIIV